MDTNTGTALTQEADEAKRKLPAATEDTASSVLSVLDLGATVVGGCASLVGGALSLVGDCFSIFSD